jgi:hypothetical protein
MPASPPASDFVMSRPISPPCPFCGSRDLRMCPDHSGPPLNARCGVSYCGSCGRRGPSRSPPAGRDGAVAGRMGPLSAILSAGQGSQAAAGGPEYANRRGALRGFLATAHAGKSIQEIQRANQGLEPRQLARGMVHSRIWGSAPHRIARLNEGNNHVSIGFSAHHYAAPRVVLE